jgi:hypothetical protein
MGYHHHSRLVTLGETLAALVQTGALAAVMFGGLAGEIVRAPFAQPRAGCGCERRERCCYDPPAYRCGGW